jgi:hypothetical protein
MRFSRKPLKSRDLMIAVVAFALSLKLGLSYSHSASYWREAHFYAQAADSARLLADLYDRDQVKSTTPKPIGVSEADPPGLNLSPAERQREAERCGKFADYLDRMRGKYRRAAFLPWLPNAPEPPEY